MARVHLSDELIQSHAYGKGGRQADYLWDLVRVGFGVRTYPSGRKAFVVQLDAGPRIVCDWPTFTLEEAWLAARRLQQQELLGGVGLPQLVTGPAPAIAAGSHAVEDLAREHYAWMQAKRKPAAADDVWRRYRLAILPEWGGRLLSTLAAAELERWHQAQEHRKVWANRALETLRAGWNHAERWGWVPPASNPLAHFGSWRWDERKRERVLSDDEAVALYAALDELEPLEAHAASVACVRLILLTGLRHQEACQLHWGEVFVERGVLVIQEHKSSRKKGPKVVALGARALELLGAVRRAKGTARVFPGHSNLYTTWRAVRERAGVLGDVTIHDLRRTFATRLFEAGQTTDRIARMLGDTTVQMVATTYVHPDAAKAFRTAADLAGSLMSRPEPGRQAVNH